MQIPKPTLKRLPVYLKFLKEYKLTSGNHTVSSPIIARGLSLNEVQVRKDLALVSCGRPKIGYIIDDLAVDIENFLGYNNINTAVLVGAGKLGQALLSYSEFKTCGVEIIAAFDNDPEKIGSSFGGKKIFDCGKISDLCSRLGVHIGIITVPSQDAQQACDALIAGGVRAIWNFAPVHLKVPQGILVQNENMAAGLSVLSQHLCMQLGQL